MLFRTLIEAVREFPCIWDMACKGYKDTIAKGNAWKEVSKKVTVLSQLSVIGRTQNRFGLLLNLLYFMYNAHSSIRSSRSLQSFSSNFLSLQAPPTNVSVRRRAHVLCEWLPPNRFRSLRSGTWATIRYAGAIVLCEQGFRLELAELAEELAAVVPFVSLSECFRMVVRLSVLVSATIATCCYLYMYTVDGILGSASVRLVYSRLGRQACVVQNTSNCSVQLLLHAQCAQGTCLATGYSFSKCIEAGCLLHAVMQWHCYRVYCLLLGYRNY